MWFAYFDEYTGKWVSWMRTTDEFATAGFAAPTAKSGASFCFVLAESEAELAKATSEASRHGLQVTSISTPIRWDIRRNTLTPYQVPFGLCP